jgi:hypothetical protein
MTARRAASATMPARVLITVLAAALATQAPARAHAASTVAAISPSLSPDRLGAKGALTVTIRYTTGTSGVPAPMLRSVIEFPAGLGLEIPHLRSCSAARLQVSGISGCPTQSYLGTGNALAVAYLGTQPVPENVTLNVFLGPPQNFQPTVNILGQGVAPIGEEALLTATVLPDHPPYGEQMVLLAPSIPTLPSQPNASILSFTLTIGTSSHKRKDANRIVVPSRCPAGGFPFAAQFTYADGSSGSAFATVPCPR